jgi:F1F0 ATPase subunit 2
VKEILTLLSSGIAGTLMGLVFFVGLWTTVNHLRETRRPAIWIFTSLMLRFGLILAGFFFFARFGGWEHLLAAVTGFILSRLFIVHRLRPGHIKERSNT